MKGATLQTFMACGLFMAAVPAFAQSWTPTSAPLSPSWNSVASSADGTKLAATTEFSGLYTSTNSGMTWQTNIFSNVGPGHVVSSAEGTTLAVVFGQYVYVSTNWGVTWQTNGPIGQDLNGLACSADGTKMVMIDPAGNGGHVFTSTNSGVTWVTNALAGKSWTGVASSADGSRLIGIVSGIGGPTNQFYTSTNAGISWVTNGLNLTPVSWQCVASSADGTKLVVGSSSGAGNVSDVIFTSADGGATWTFNNVPRYEWNSLACSADGSKLIACSAGYTKIYTSTNFGSTWVSNSVPADSWQGVASSADGNKLVAVAALGGIYTWQATPSPQLNLAASSGNLTASWTVPCTNFVLQESLGLTSGNWTTVTNPPGLNLTNLQEQVTISPTNANAFFRLATP